MAVEKSPRMASAVGRSYYPNVCAAHFYFADHAYRGCTSSHARARRWASMMSSRVIPSAMSSRELTATSRAKPVDQEADRLNHMCADTLS